MQATIRIQTTVLPGQRIEFSSPELTEGDTVEVIVVLPEPVVSGRRTILDFLDSLPPGPRSFPTWDEMEHQFQEERNSWDH